MDKADYAFLKTNKDNLSPDFVSAHFSTRPPAVKATVSDWIAIVIPDPDHEIVEATFSVTVTTPDLRVVLIMWQIDELMKLYKLTHVWIQPIPLGEGLDRDLPNIHITQFLSAWMDVLHLPRKSRVTAEFTAIQERIPDAEYGISLMSNFYVPQEVVHSMMALHMTGDEQTVVTAETVSEWVELTHGNRFEYTPAQILLWYRVMFAERNEGSFFCVERDTDPVEGYLVPKPRLLAELIYRVGGLP